VGSPAQAVGLRRQGYIEIDPNTWGEPVRYAAAEQISNGDDAGVRLGVPVSSLATKR
jgi:hypothetical protein